MRRLWLIFSQATTVALAGYFVVATLKPKPGVYRMHDARGDVLYVGKAASLE